MIPYGFPDGFACFWAGDWFAFGEADGPDAGFYPDAVAGMQFATPKRDWPEEWGEHHGTWRDRWSNR